MSSLESHLHELIVRTVHVANLGTAWIDAFRPLFHIEHVQDGEADWIEIRFDYLGATSRYEYRPEEDSIAEIVADAAQSFGHSLQWEVAKFGALEFPAPPHESVVDSKPPRDVTQLIGSLTQVGNTRLRLHASRSLPMKVACVAVVLTLVLVLFKALGLLERLYGR